MFDIEMLKKDYMNQVNESVKESLLENGVSEEETESIMHELKEDLKQYKVVVDIPFAIVSILQEMYDSENYKRILEEIEKKQELSKNREKGLESEEFAIGLTRVEKRQFTYAMLDYLEERDLLQLFLHLWSKYISNGEMCGKYKA